MCRARATAKSDAPDSPHTFAKTRLGRPFGGQPAPVRPSARQNAKTPNHKSRASASLKSIVFARPEVGRTIVLVAHYDVARA